MKTISQFFLLLFSVPLSGMNPLLAQWVQTNGPGGSVHSLTVSGTNLFAGTGGGGVWSRPLSEMTTGIKNDNNHIPTRFALDQNYPIPFNPTTTVRFDLPKQSEVTLKIYDMLGREVAALVNGETMQAGSFSKVWDASHFASGVYFFRLQPGI